MNVNTIEWKTSRGSGATTNFGFVRLTVAQSGPLWRMFTSGAYYREDLVAKTLEDAKVEAVAKLRELMRLAVLASDVALGRIAVTDERRSS